MRKQSFTHEETASLLNNKNVVRVGEAAITYHPDFKLAAVQRWKEGLPPSAIFQEAGFDLAVIGRKTPKWRIAKWRRLFDQRGAARLRRDGRGAHSAGRPPKPAFKTDKEKLKYLEAQVAYLKEENRFFAKLRKQRVHYGHSTDTGSSER